MNRFLLRFDVRLEQNDYLARDWDDSRRDDYLLRPEIEWPLSVDPLVWPSGFSSKIFRDVTIENLFAGDASKFSGGYIEVAPETDRGWSDLAMMRAHYAAHNPAGKTAVPVALQLFSEQALQEWPPHKGFIPYTISNNIQCAFIVPQTNPSDTPAGSELLGYDVADASWISGLTNCSYTPEERSFLRQTWAPRLNSFGLLQTLEEARAFRELSNRRVPEHAPFWIYGITRLPSA